MIDAQALATRIEKSHVISVMEQFEKPGPVWAMPLSDDEKDLIVWALRAVAEIAGEQKTTTAELGYTQYTGYRP